MNTMNTLCDQLIADMTEAQEDTALLTGLASYTTIHEAIPTAFKAGYLIDKAMAWNRHGQWLQFTFKKDADCESGWAITARWLADKPKWVAAPAKPQPRYKSMMIPIDRVAEVAALLNSKEVAS